jgi:hypothetical protein
MMKKALDPRIELLLALYDQAYDSRAWHGQNLRGSIRRVKLNEALWRPTPKHHNIWELVIHIAYWKYAVWRRITGEKRGSFERDGSNWIKVPKNPDAAAWKKDIALLDDIHTRLREEIANLNLNRFDRHDLLYGVASHDLYHAGQIQLLKRLQRGGMTQGS